MVKKEKRLADWFFVGDNYYVRLTECPDCKSPVKIITDIWLGESKAKANIEKIKNMARDECVKCHPEKEMKE